MYLLFLPTVLKPGAVMETVASNLGVSKGPGHNVFARDVGMSKVRFEGTTEVQHVFIACTHPKS